MVIKVGINGFGRVGRVVFRTCFEQSDIEISAINDPAVDVNYICYLVKFDSTHGKFNGDVTHTEKEITVNDTRIKVFHAKTPASIPWHAAGVQYVVEASGMFTSLEKASGHLASDGVKRIIVTAPSADVPMLILGVNDNKINSGHKVVSCGSSTLYCLAPIVKVLEDKYGVEDGFITSIHAMTPSLKPLDGLCLRGKHWRDHRSIHQNIIPATTGACKALGKIIPAVRDKITGLAFRVPIVNVSVLDLTIRLTRATSLEDIVKSIEKESESSMGNIIKISKDEAVSSDFAGDSHSCIVDADSSIELKPNYYKLICWYENEYSYACRVIDTIFFSEKQMLRSEIKTKMTYVRSKFKKHDSIQQTDCCIRNTPVDRAHTTEFKPKVLCSTSQNAGFKNKLQPRPVILRKPFTQNSGVTSSFNNQILRKKAELFKIWNDNNIQIMKPATQQKRSNFFQSCITFGPKDSTTTDCIKSQERLDKVKKEFSKMVNITEDLLRKSCNNKLHSSNTSEKSKNNSKINIIKMNSKDADKNYYSKAPDTNKNNLAFDVSGDGKTSVSTLNSNIVNSVDSNIFYEKDMSDYSVPISDIKYFFKSDNSFSLKKETSSKENAADINVTTNKRDCSNHTDNEPRISDFKNHVTKTINTIMDGLTNNFQYKPYTNKNIRKIDNKESLQEDCAKNTDSASISSTRNLNNKYDITLVIPGIKVQNKLLNDSSDTNSNIVQYEKGHCNKMINNSFNKNMVNISLLGEELKRRSIVLANYDREYIKNNDQAHVKAHNSKKSKLNIAPLVSSKESNPEWTKDENFNMETLNVKSANCLLTNTLETNNVCAEAGDYQNSTITDVNFETNTVTEKSGDFRKENFRQDHFESDYIRFVVDDSQEEIKPEIDNFKTQNESSGSHRCERATDLQRPTMGSLNALIPDSTVLAEDNVSCSSLHNVSATISDNITRNNQDIYDKLDSTSATDSDISFHIDGRKSQIINITDLTNSLEDLERLDKICRIIEISDELSDKLFSSLNNDNADTKTDRKWSFKDLCEKINLDEFCNKVFGKSM